MIAPAVSLLLERLLWPIPRIRWETARGIAKLIRAGDLDTKTALLEWMGQRQLESEAILSLGIIDGFDLGKHFTFSDVAKAVRAPSHLSDYLLKKNFPDASGLFPFRYEISPAEPASLPPAQVVWFQRYKHSAVPPIFDNTLRRLQQASGWPFLERWEHDWRWVQTQHPRPMLNHPWYFTASDRDNVGQLDMGQRETYVSAFLRTLAHAAVEGLMPHHIAEYHSLVALTLNPGLADLEPIERPAWSMGLASATDEIDAVARRLWADAEAYLKPNEALLNLYAVDRDENAFVEFDMALAIGQPGFSAIAPNPAELRAFTIGGGTSDYVAAFQGGIQPSDIPLDEPLVTTQNFYPAAPGRFNAEIATQIRLASPYLFEGGNVECTGRDIRMVSAGRARSRWVHWYADWAPTTPRELGTTLCSLTSVAAADLDRVLQGVSAEVRIWLQLKQGKRPQSYSDYEISTDRRWLAL